jgi:superoxide dismutase, Fe-Mn family
MQFILPNLPYKYFDLEPFIDSRTMEIHHSKHHQAYINNLNEAIGKYPKLRKRSLVYLLKNLKSLPEDIRLAVKNNGGGHYNHTFYWEIMAPNNQENLSPALLDKIQLFFTSFDEFKNQFSQAAIKHFGSGWVWLVVNKDKHLKIYSTANQDSPLVLDDDIPLLNLDVWEHAYYLKYQNRRADYVQNWWNVVNWEKVSQNFEEAIK